MSARRLTPRSVGARPSRDPLASPVHGTRRRHHRLRPGRPAARAGVRRPRAADARRRQRPRAPRRGPRRAACRSRSPGAQEVLDRVQRGGHDRDAPTGSPMPRRRGTSSSRWGRRRSRTSRSTCATSARRSTTCCRTCGAGHAIILRSTIAPGTTEFVAGYLAKHRGFEVGEDVFVAHVPERIAAGRFFEEIVTLPCIVGGVGERSGEVVGRAVRRVRRADRADDAGAGRAGQDLDEHPALRARSRCPTC